MSAARTIGAIEVNALADGELVGEAADEVRQAMADDDALKHLAIWRDALSERLHSAYDGILDAPIPSRTAAALRRPGHIQLPHAASRIAAAAAIAVVAAGLGYVAGFELLGAEHPVAGFAELALGAHKIYASEVLHPVEVSGADSEQLHKWLGKRLGVDLPVPDIKETGFTLVGGRLLAEGQHPAALLMYEDASGQRVTLYIEKSSPDGSTALRHASNSGFGTYYWIDSPLACAVSGNLADSELKTVAERIYKALDKG